MRIRGFALTLVLTGIAVEAQQPAQGAHCASWNQLAFAAAA